MFNKIVIGLFNVVVENSSNIVSILALLLSIVAVIISIVRKK